ncbi:hypothetical protein N0V84_007072 [Fusarium piperis]|uniref:Amine oxidase domain-containing protein n=1 Tax=Fusarium piperis TaxID=1435070 RepID=A0A9W9BNS2_9HYPO|nr:hypothetical protein N0V84_007072 [Fusarium piperis]
MGGTWISHVHGRVFGEMVRYGLKDDFSITRTENGGCDYFTLDTGFGSRKFTYKKAAEMPAKAWGIFINTDGNTGREIYPLPYSTLGNSCLSCRDRIDQIKDQLSADELALLKSLVPYIGGGSVENFGYDIATFEEVWTLYKILEGRSTLVRRIFDDAVRLGLQYSFKTPIKSIVEREGIVSLHISDGKIVRDQRVVNTIPIAVLPDIHFDPPLSPLHQEATRIGQVGYLTKVHVEVEGGLRGLRGCT